MRSRIPAAFLTLLILALPLLAAVGPKEVQHEDVWDKTRTVKFTWSLTPGGHLAWELVNKSDRAVKVTFKADAALKGDGPSKRHLTLTETLQGRGFKKDQYNLVWPAAALERARKGAFALDVTDFRVEATAKK